MYIAIKWLVSMAFAMWITLCSIDRIQRKLKKSPIKEIDRQHFLILYNKNLSLLKQQNILESNNNYYKLPGEYPNESFFIQYLTFLAGVCMVFIFHRKNDIILFSKRKINNFDMIAMKRFLKLNKPLKEIAVLFSAAIPKFTKLFQLFFMEFNSIFSCFIRSNQPNINIALLNKLKEHIKERRNLGRLLISVIRENKNIRMHYKYETMSKGRTILNIKDSGRQLNEMQSKYVSFQQLYLLTYQENMSLKSRLKNLIQEKEVAERNLIKLINQVYQSKNNVLKAYCSRFIVQTRKNLLKCDLKTEIEMFMQKLLSHKQSEINNRLSKQNLNENDLKCCTLKKHEILNEKKLIALLDSSSKIKSLPGICVWIVKDKNGIIEKLYEYDTDLDNNDTVKRIRQYSVYYDTECLLDFSDSSALLKHPRTDVPNSTINIYNVRCCIPSQRFLTNSKEFKTFLENNKNVVVRRSSTATTTIL